MLGGFQSPTFISYMGVGRSDIRIAPRPSDDVSEQYNNMAQYLNSDPGVMQFAPFVTGMYPIK